MDSYYFSSGPAPAFVQLDDDQTYVSSRRLKVYKAEDRAAVIWPVPLLDGAEITAQHYVDRITTSAWWRRNLYGVAPHHVHVFARYGGSGSYARYGYRKHSRYPKRGACHWISLGTGTNSERGIPHCRDPWVILHELAHIMCCVSGHKDEGHGALFARYYLALVRRWLGPEAAGALREAYKVERVKYRKVSA